MFRQPILIALFALLPLIAVTQQKEYRDYSRAATPLWDKLVASSYPSDAALVIESPDHRSRIAANVFDRGGVDNGEHVTLDVSGEIGALHLDIGPGVGSELHWSPDSKALFINTSDQGRNGAYRLLVVDIFQGKLQSRELTELVHRRFGHPFRCGWSESPNVVGIGWVGQTHRVWVAAEVIHHSNCDSFGTFKAYEIDPASMKILQALGQLEAKRQLKDMLGNALIDAPDECIRDPKTCYVAANHPELSPPQ